MACTTILVGSKATNDGSTIVARNEDTGDGTFIAKKMVVVEPSSQPRVYTGVTNHLTMELPDNPMRYVCVPNADPSAGVWGEAGINAANVSMTATETISSNARVLGADPLVPYQPAKGRRGTRRYVPEQAGGIGEENFVTIVLPYIRSAKEGVQRLGSLLEQYGTYEMNGVAFGDEKEIWYIETIGGHHWIARRVPDDCYVAQPNRQGIDWFDFRDALGEQRDYMCSRDLPQWMADNHLCMTLRPDDTETIQPGVPVAFNPRYAFSSFTWLDIVYNNPRAWYITKMFNHEDPAFNGPDAKFGPESMDIPWCVCPPCKLSVMDVKNMLSSTYDGTPYNCYGLQGTAESRSRFREIGINRTGECSILNIRPNSPAASRAVQWVSFGSGPFNASLAIFTNVDSIPAYLDTGTQVTTDKLYWQDRIVAGLADPEFFDNEEAIMNYQQDMMTRGYEALRKVDAQIEKTCREESISPDDMDNPRLHEILEDANQEIADMAKKGNDALLASVLYTRSNHMANRFGASDH